MLLVLNIRLYICIVLYLITGDFPNIQSDSVCFLTSLTEEAGEGINYFYYVHISERVTGYMDNVYSKKL